MAHFIPDGYTRDGYIAAEERNGEVDSEAVRFKYRPAVASEFEELSFPASKEESASKKTKFVTGHLVSWDLRHDGNVLPINSDICSRLSIGFRDRLIGIIAQTHFSDRDPTGKAIVKTEAELAKNSVPA